MDLPIDLEKGDLPGSLVEWLEGNIGPLTDFSLHDKQWYGDGWSAWRKRSGASWILCFYIKDPRKATLLKLAWI
jgi:hypothetical protein